ncbi:MAG: hypothetical protein V3T74_01790 [Gemmatimonadales bacterium]
MTDQDRREFLKKLAKTAAYTAPVVYSLAAPIELVGQGQSSEHKHTTAPATQQPSTGDAPWDRPPPGQRP